MRMNRSIPLCTVIPVLIYSDPGTAADWLSNAFGFTVRLRIANHRIQMKAGDGCFTIAEGKDAPPHNRRRTLRQFHAEKRGKALFMRNCSTCHMKDGNEYFFARRQPILDCEATTRRPTAAT